MARRTQRENLLQATKEKIRVAAEEASVLHELIAKGEPLRQARAVSTVEVLKTWLDDGRICGSVKGTSVWGVRISLEPRGFRCMCPDLHHRGGPCKHVLALAAHWLATVTEPALRHLYAESGVVGAKSGEDMTLKVLSSMDGVTRGTYGSPRKTRGQPQHHWQYRNLNGHWSLQVRSPNEGDPILALWSGQDSYFGDPPKDVVVTLVRSLLSRTPWPSVDAHFTEVTIHAPWAP